MQIGGFDRQHCMTKNLWCNATASSSNRLKGSRSPGTNGFLYFLLTGRWFVTQFELWPDLRWTTGINHRQMFSASLVNLWTLVWVGTGMAGWVALGHRTWAAQKAARGCDDRESDHDSDRHHHRPGAVKNFDVISVISIGSWRFLIGFLHFSQWFSQWCCASHLQWNVRLFEQPAKEQQGSGTADLNCKSLAWLI